MGGAAAARGGTAAAGADGGAVPDCAGAAVREDREPPGHGDQDHGHGRRDGTPAADVRRGPAPLGTRLRQSPLALGC